MAYIRTRKTADGPRYDVRYAVNGQRRTDTFRLERDANSRLTKVRADELAGLVVDPKGGERLFGEYCEEWLEHRLVKGRPLTLMTRQGYAGLLRRNISPHFGGTKLRQITHERVRRWYSDLTASAGSDQAAKSYRLLRAILNTAVSDELIARNPCVIKGAGIERTPERPMLDTATVLQLADAIQPRLRALVLVAGFRTLRPGELLGLQRRDIDLLHGTIRVERQAHEITGRGRILTDTKSEAGTRTLALPAPIANELGDHLHTYVAAGREAWVFTRPSGLPLRRADLSNAWKDACAAVGLTGVHPHDLRHHAATVSARDPNVTLKELMSMMGHASPRAALVYQHATEERDRAHADYLAGVIQAAERAPKSGVVRLSPQSPAPSTRHRAGSGAQRGKPTAR
jgi:integrase